MRDKKPSMKFVADVDEVIEAARHANKMRKIWVNNFDGGLQKQA